jgi:hypothetical protein
MDELIPVALGTLLGVLIWRAGSNRLRFALGVGAVVVVGFLATVFSDEYLESWLYLFIDFAEAAAGLLIGFICAHVWRARIRARQALPRHG